MVDCFGHSDFPIKGRYYVDTVFYLELFKANNSTVIIFI